MADRNDDLERLHTSLIELIDQLADRQQQATSVDVVVALSREISEVNHRVVMVGQLVFHAATDKIVAAVKGVDDGRAAVDQAIREIDKLNRFLKVISGFLGLVDKVVDIAKLL